MSNELFEICKRLERDSIVDPTGSWIVTRAERVEGGWELRVVKQKPEEAENENN